MSIFNTLLLIFTFSPVVILGDIRHLHATFAEIQEEDSEVITKPYYAVDPVRTDQLAYLERNIFAALSELYESSTELKESCKLHLSNYLKEYEKDSQVIQDTPEVVTENPLLTFRMIRRIVKDLLTDIRTSCGDEDVAMETVHQLFTQEDLSLPTENDLKDAILGILRIHYIHGFNATSELSHGILNGLETNVSLSGEDCLALANGAIQEFSADKLAYQWLVAAKLLGKQKQVGEDKKFKEELSKGWKELEELVGKSKKALRKALRGKRQERMEGFMEFQNFAGCRGETMLPVENQAQLFCYRENRWNPYFFINPVKTEVLSLDPVIGYFHDFFGDQTVNFIRELGSQKMRRSGVVSEGDESKMEVSPYRSSMSGWVPDPEEATELNVDWGIMEKLNKRVEKLTGLEVNKKGASNMQVVRYGAMGYYGFHWDSLAQQAPIAIEKEGDREATLLIYLTDTKMGGNTVFPYIGVHAKPKKGSAILFYSLKLNGEPDQRTMHGACPILLGTKEVANKWIMQYANMFKQPCSLYPDY